MDLNQFVELISKYGFGAVSVAAVITIFIWLIYYMSTNLTRRFDEIIIELKILQDLTKNDNLDYLSIESAKSIIKNQLTISKYEIIEELMRIYSENDLKNPTRQAILGDRLYGLIKNLVNRDNDLLSKYKYKENKLTYFTENFTAECITKPLLKMMFERSMSISDIHREINTIFNSIINKSKENVNQLD